MFVGSFASYAPSTTNDIMHRVMSGVISSTNQSTTSLPNLELLKAEYTPRTIVRLVNIFNCLAYDWMIKDKRKVT